MNKELILKSNYPTLYNLFGIYVDWQIDNNLVEGLGIDPHGIKSFQAFLETKNWQVVEIQFDGQAMLALNLNLPKLKLLNLLNIKVVKVIKGKLKGAEALKRLEVCQKKSNMPSFDIFHYYMSNVPWDLTSHAAMNNNHNRMIIDLSSLSQRIIIKVRTTEGLERITSANDILEGEVSEHEFLIDPKRYDDETSYEMEKYLSEKLGIPVLGSDERIDVSYKYPLA